jgi:hypothetical protein
MDLYFYILWFQKLHIYCDLKCFWNVFMRRKMSWKVNIFSSNWCRTKLKQTEVDCEYLKRCCENLTEENRRLQKEVQELRALKLSPQLYMHMNPPTTLTMCPSCERVAVSSASSSSAAAASSALAPTASTRQPQRPVPINPWATMPVHQRTFDAPASRSWLLAWSRGYLVKIKWMKGFRIRFPGIHRNLRECGIGRIWNKTRSVVVVVRMWFCWQVQVAKSGLVAKCSVYKL